MPEDPPEVGGREADRLAELGRLGAVRPEADGVLQELVDDAREIFGAELCMANLVTEGAQYFRAWSGELPAELAEARQDPRERSMCQHVVEVEAPLVVEDFLAAERFKDQHFRVRYGVRFYAGTPLVTSGGHAIGSLCLLDTRPRAFPDENLAVLRAFAKAVVGRLEALGALARERAAREDVQRLNEDLERRVAERTGRLEAAVAELEERGRALEESEERFRLVARATNEAIWDNDVKSGAQRWAGATEALFGYPAHEGTDGGWWEERLHPEDRGRVLSILEETLAPGGGEAWSDEYRFRRADGGYSEVVDRGHVVRDAATGVAVRMVGAMADVTERKALERRLEHLALHDPLTGLPNRRLFSDRLEQALGRLPRRGGGVAVLYADLDGFKAVNDSLGHGAGDGLLVAAAGRLRGCVRPPDTVSRLGGDEFAVLLEGPAVGSEAVEVAGRILRAMRSPFKVGGREARVTASVGVALGAPAAALGGAHNLLREADAAMYRAKRAGKARLEVSAGAES